MSIGIPPLSYLCLQQINKSHPTCKSALVKELNELEQCAKEWKWIPFYPRNDDETMRLDFATTCEKAFKALSGSSQFFCKNNSLPFKHQHFTTIQKVLDFIDEHKIPISHVHSDLFGKKHIGICFDVPSKKEACKLFDIELPNPHCMDNLAVRFTDPSFISSFLKKEWTQIDANKLKCFAIYYINQLTKDNLYQDTNRYFYRPDPKSTEKRISRAIDAKSKQEMIQRLFE